MAIEVFGNGRAGEINNMESSERVVLGNNSYVTSPDPTAVAGELYVGGKLVIR
jgi:hypothetical protein